MDSAFLKALALARPDPGGGAAAAHSAALGLALLAKVVQLEHQRQGPARKPRIPLGRSPGPGERRVRGAPALAGRGCQSLFPVRPGPNHRRPRITGRGPRRGGGLSPQDHAAGSRWPGLDGPGRGRVWPSPDRGLAGGLRVAGRRLSGGAPHRPGQPAAYAPGLPAGRLGRGITHTVAALEAECCWCGPNSQTGMACP